MTDVTWDERFLALAAFVARWSKDPSTKAGCVLVRPDRTVASLGYNGLPRGVRDEPERLDHRPTKYAMTVHAEINAVLTAQGTLVDCAAYIHPLPPCSPCAAALIQAGVRRVLAPEPNPGQLERWADSFAYAATMFSEAGVRLELV